MANKQPDKYLEKIQKLSILLIEGIEELNTNEEYFIDICTYFIKNKVSFIDIYKKASSLNSLFFKSAYFQRHIENEKKQYDQWLNDFKIIKNSWDKKNIRYLFHKSVGSFPHLSDNLDVLVETTDFIQAGIDLKRLNYINLRNIQEEHKEFYRKF